MKTGPLWLWIAAALALLVALSFLLPLDPEHHHQSHWSVSINDGTIIAAILVAVVLHRSVCWTFRR